MLRALDVDIVALREELDQQTSDTGIFKHLAASHRVFVSEDRRQLTRMCEVAELRAAGVNAIYFAPFWGRLGFWGQAEWLVKRWRIIDDVQRGLENRGIVVEISQKGKSRPVAI